MNERTQIGGTLIDPADARSGVDWHAHWLRDPIFDGVDDRELIHPGRSEELNGEIRNVDTLLRREFNLCHKPIRRADLYITADDCYKLYVNGQFIGLGPAPAYPFDYPYNAWDVTGALAPDGPNCIGVHAFYHGMHSLTFPSGDNLQGVLVQLKIAFDDGSTTTIVSDGDWRCLRTDAYESRQVLGYQTAFSEHINLRKLPVDWHRAGFDDRRWRQPLVGDIPESGYALDSTTCKMLWLLRQLDLKIQTAVRAFVALYVAVGPSVLLRTCFDGIRVHGRPHAPFPRVLIVASVATQARRVSTGCGRWSQVHTPIPECYSLSPQSTPPVAVFRRPPQRIVKKAQGHYFIDFGTQLTGCTAFCVTGKAGHEVEIRHGEELLGPDTVRYEMRCNCTYQEFCTLCGNVDETLEFFDYKGFRYVEVLNWPDDLTAERVWAYERHYPFPEDASYFASSDPLLNDIWTLCRNGVRVGTIDTFLDCPTREKGGFMGDGFVTGLSHLILTGDARIMRKFLKDVANTSRYCPGLHSTAPNYVNGELAEYSLLWPVLLDYYYQWTGDLDFVCEMMPVLNGLLRYYTDYENADGLLQDVYSRATGRYSVLVDWPKNLRDDYDDPYLMGDRQIEADPRGVVNTMVQGFYSNALRAAERLADIADCTSVKQRVLGRRARLHAAALAQLRDPMTGLFIDRNGSGHSALHANITPLLAGMLGPDDRATVVDFIRGKRLSCGVYFSWFVLKALYAVGESDLAHELMTSRDLHSWHSMLEAGATTCMEAWAPDLKWNTSWCHPWSSAPIHMTAHHVMGLRPAEPGWRQIRFAPRPPADLDSATIRLTTPRGPIDAAFERGDNHTAYQLNVPPDTPVACAFDRTIRRVVVDGTEVDCHEKCDDFGVPAMVVNDALAGGEYTIVTTSISRV